MKIIKGKIAGAKKTVIYGPEGIGKSTFASCFPDPLFIDTEGSTKYMDISRTEAPSSWTMLLEQVRYIKANAQLCRTLVIDTADWAEMLCIESVCSKAQKSGIEDFGYGKGYVYLAEEFGRLLNLLSDVVDLGIHVVVTAHAKMRKFEQPDEMGAYDRWELKLQKQTAPLLKEWADMLLFANYKTIVVNVDGQGAQKGKNKAQGGRRVMYTAHHACWDAKNRYGLPEEIAFEYASIAHVIGDNAATHYLQPVESQPAHVQNAANSVTEPGRNDSKPAENVSKAVESVSKGTETAPDPELPPPRVLIDSDPEKVPKALVDLMRESRVNEWDVMEAVALRGYVPTGTPIDGFDKANPGIVEGLLIPNWDQVYQMIQEIKDKEEVPFN